MPRRKRQGRLAGSRSTFPARSSAAAGREGRGRKEETLQEAPPQPEPEREATEEPAVAEEASPAAPAAKKKTRRGSRGGKNRKKKPAAATNGAEAGTDTGPAPEAEPASENGDFDYVPMAEWADELESKG